MKDWNTWRAAGLALATAGAVAVSGAAPGRALADATTSADGVTASIATNSMTGITTLSVAATNGPSYSTALDCESDCSVITPQVVRTGPGPRPDVIVEMQLDGGGGATEVDDVAYSVARRGWVEATEIRRTAPSLVPLAAGYSALVGQHTFGTFYPDAAGPIQVQRSLDGSFVDVTRRYPALIAGDAASWLAAYQTADPKFNAPQLAAYLADEFMLGNAKPALAYLRSQTGKIFSFYDVPTSPGDLLATVEQYGYRP